MPKYRITAPDGKTYNVTTPEGQDVNPEAILGALKARTTPKPITGDQYDEAWLANVAGLGFEFGDEAVAGVRSVFGSDYDKELAQVRQSQQKLAEYDPLGNVIGKVAGGLPVAMLTGGPATQVAARVLPNAGRVGQAAAVGAGFGAGAGFGSGEGGVANRLQSGAIGAAFGAGFGATVEGVVSPAVAQLLQRFRGKPQLLDETTGTLTPTGRSLAERAGVNPDELSSAYQAEFAKQAQDAINPADASRLAQARSLPVPVPTTKGQNTLDPEC